jgi:hypothetical protein
MSVPNTYDRKQQLLDEIAEHDTRIRELRCILQGYSEAEELLMHPAKKPRGRPRKPRASRPKGDGAAAQTEMQDFN